MCRRVKRDDDGGGLVVVLAVGVHVGFLEGTAWEIVVRVDLHVLVAVVVYVEGIGGGDLVEGVAVWDV